jgi:hypothetical protein
MGYRLRLPHVTRICGKHRFHDQAEAQGCRDALARWEHATGTAKPGKLGTYWCDRCQAYHVGHNGAGGKAS